MQGAAEAYGQGMGAKQTPGSNDKKVGKTLKEKRAAKQAKKGK